MTDLAIWKTIEKDRIVEGVSSMIQDNTSYNAGNMCTLHLPGARAERIMKNVDLVVTHRGISKNQWDSKDTTTTIYDYKKRLWTWKITGAYATSSYTGSHNFYTDARMLLDDGGDVSLTMQDKTVTVFPLDAVFSWQGGALHVVEYTIEFIEGYKR